MTTLLVKICFILYPFTACVHTERPKTLTKMATMRKTNRFQVWWDNFVNDIVVSQEWKENFRFGKENFLKLCNE